MAAAVAPPYRRHRGSAWSAIAAVAEFGALLLQAEFAIILDTSLWHLAIAAYLAAIALDEIDFRSLLGGIAERRFQRIAMSLGDGLVCADHNGLITVWNPGAVAIFGYQPADMIGQPLDRICALGDGATAGHVLDARTVGRPAGLERQDHGAGRPPQERRDVPARSLVLQMGGRSTASSTAR